MTGTGVGGAVALGALGGGVTGSVIASAGNGYYPGSRPTVRRRPDYVEETWHVERRGFIDPCGVEHGRAGRKRNTLDECKPHEDVCVAALMAARPDADFPLHDWARTWAAYVSFVMDPVWAWIGALRR
ncbi:hypothetical protein R1A27_32465 (plasmid) [Methylobacterium sp. NMS12]|uniref:hypothetical protein n=1 Tax=Methylobacterium sp. NMS12 TaxID=3079766 RepID=UPI003F8811F5